MRFLMRLVRVALNLLPLWRLIFSAWTSPNSPSAGDDWTATMYRTYIRDNLNYLLNGQPYSTSPTYLGTAITGTTTSFAAVSTTNARITLTTVSGRVKGVFEFPFKLSFSGSGTVYAWFDVAINGTRLGDSTLGLVIAPTEGAGTLCHVVVPFQAVGVTPGSVNIDLYWKLKVNSGTGYQMNILCTSASDGHAPLVKQAWEF